MAGSPIKKGVNIRFLGAIALAGLLSGLSGCTTGLGEYFKKQSDHIVLVDEPSDEAAIETKTQEIDEGSVAISLKEALDNPESTRTEADKAAQDELLARDSELNRPAIGFRQALKKLDDSANRLALDEAWELALSNDAGYQAATSAKEAAQTQIAQGRSQLLPQISAGYSRSKSKGMQRQASPFGGYQEGRLNYDSDSRYVQLQQPVFDVGSFAGYQLGKALAQLGDADWKTAKAELGMRLAGTWFEALTAQARLALHEALTDSLAQQFKAQVLLYKHAEGSIVDMQQTHARLDSAKADIITAQARLDVALRTLASVIGVQAAEKVIQTGPFFKFVKEVEIKKENSDSPAFPLPQLQPAKLVQWLDRARTNNTNIGAQQAQVQVANARVLQAASRHSPTLSFVASWSKADSENLALLSRRTNSYMAGLQLNVPLFSGGHDTALHSQTRDEARQAGHELHATLQETLVRVKRHYQEIAGGKQRVLALQSSVAAGEESLYAANKAFEYGVGSNLDLLRKQDRLFETRLKLIEAMRDYIQAHIALKITVGMDPQEVFFEAWQTFFQ